MVNNEFHVIGVATSNYQDISNGTYISHLLKVEVEKFGSKAGKSFELEIQIYGTNKSINTKQEVLGKQVAINGYLDSYLTKEGSRITKMVAQNVFVFGKTSDKGAEVVAKSDDHGFDNKGEAPQPFDAAEIPDDDLPF